MIPLVYGATCLEGDGCEPSCVNGDKDCTCNTLEGYVCSDDQYCEGNLIKNAGDKICCSKPCVTGSELSEDTTVAVLTKDVEEEKVEQKRTNKKVGVGVVILVGFMIAAYFLRRILIKSYE